MGISTEVFFPTKCLGHMTDDMFKEKQEANIAEGNRVGVRVFESTQTTVTEENSEGKDEHCKLRENLMKELEEK